MADSTGTPPASRGPIVWKDRASWVGEIGDWLQPYFKDGGRARLESALEKNLCWDDDRWLEKVLASVLAQPVEIIIDFLADDLTDRVVRVYHGCRVADAGVFHREGLRLNTPEDRDAAVRAIVAEEDDLAWFRPNLEEKLAAWDARERDTGLVYASLDDKVLHDDCGHYALYGSEWVMAFLPWSAHDILRRRGAPTILEIDLPLIEVTPGMRKELAKALLQEWTHITVNRRNWTPPIDFGFRQRQAFPPEQIVGHYHPSQIIDQHHSCVTRKSAAATCPSCA